MTWGDKAKPKQNTLVILILLCFHYFILSGKKRMLVSTENLFRDLAG